MTRSRLESGEIMAASAATVGAMIQSDFGPIVIGIRSNYGRNLVKLRSPMTRPSAAAIRSKFNCGRAEFRVQSNPIKIQLWRARVCGRSWVAHFLSRRLYISRCARLNEIV